MGDKTSAEMGDILVSVKGVWLGRSGVNGSMLMMGEVAVQTVQVVD